MKLHPFEKKLQSCDKRGQLTPFHAPGASNRNPLSDFSLPFYPNELTITINSSIDASTTTYNSLRVLTLV